MSGMAFRFMECLTYFHNSRRPRISTPHQKSELELNDKGPSSQSTLMLKSYRKLADSRILLGMKW